MSDHPLDRAQIEQHVSTIFADDLHAKRVASLANAAIGLLEGAALGIHAIGRALAFAAGLESRHAVKQVDRLLSNKGIEVWQLFGSWVPFVVGNRQAIVAALDWTEYDADDQSTLALSMITSHGRATPVALEDGREVEDEGPAERPRGRAPGAAPRGPARGREGD